MRRKRLSTYISKDPVTGCWNWLGAKVRGYGRIGRYGKLYSAHAFIYTCMFGEIPSGLVFDHKCRNRGCVNPHHLDVVTVAENCRRGANAKINREIADMIRQSQETSKELAARYGLHRATILRIKNGLRWNGPGKLLVMTKKKPSG